MNLQVFFSTFFRAYLYRTISPIWILKRAIKSLKICCYWPKRNLMAFLFPRKICIVKLSHTYHPNEQFVKESIYFRLGNVLFIDLNKLHSSLFSSVSRCLTPPPPLLSIWLHSFHLSFSLSLPQSFSLTLSAILSFYLSLFHSRSFAKIHKHTLCRIIKISISRTNVAKREGK